MNERYFINAIFDNEGLTVDRFTINIMSDEGESYLITSSVNPSHALGVWSCDENMYIDLDEMKENPEDNKHIGTEIEWHELPKEVQKTLNNYFVE